MGWPAIPGQVSGGGVSLGGLAIKRAPAPPGSVCLADKGGWKGVYPQGLTLRAPVPLPELLEYQVSNEPLPPLTWDLKGSLNVLYI